MGTAGTATTGNVVLLHDTDYSNAATASITSGIDSTYGEYIFKFYNLNPATDNVQFTFQVNATDSTGYDRPITSTFYTAWHNENDSNQALEYTSGHDQQGTDDGFQPLFYSLGNGSDESAAGELHLFNPASTTYVKQFHARIFGMGDSPMAEDAKAAGYINDTTAIDDIQFKMSSGNFDGTIKMWGVK